MLQNNFCTSRVFIRCSYVLESISLAYALKVFSAYLLNCQASIKIYTDARSLIYAKRMSTHSVLLNSTLNYLTNFVSMLNISIYHIPGSINVLADVLRPRHRNLRRDHNHRPKHQRFYCDPGEKRLLIYNY